MEHIQNDMDPLSISHVPLLFVTTDVFLVSMYQLKKKQGSSNPTSPNKGSTVTLQDSVAITFVRRETRDRFGTQMVCVRG